MWGRLFYRLRKMVGAFGARFGWNWIGFALSVTIVGISLHVLAGMLQDIDLARVAANMRAMPPVNVAGGALFIACAYGTLTCYDLFALRTIGANHVPYRIAALASFTATRSATISERRRYPAGRSATAFIRSSGWALPTWR